MPTIKEKDFIELEFTGKIKEDSTIFDTTDKEIAKNNGLLQENAEYKPIIICMGQGQIIKGLENAIIGKETEKSYTIGISPEEGYGKKNAKFIQLISTSKFTKQNIQPMPGLQVNIDGTIGIVKTVSGGRTLVDFNHPLAGKELTYDIKINRIITDNKEKINSILKISLGIKDAETKIETSKRSFDGSENSFSENNNATITTKQEIPKEIHEELKKKIKELLPGIDEITIKKAEEKKEKTQNKQENLNTSKPSNKTGG